MANVFEDLDYDQRRFAAGCISWGIDNLDELITDKRDDIYAGDLHHELFNLDYYTIYHSDAVEELEKYGIFDAIERVAEWEDQNLGEVNYKDLTSPMQVCNMLCYIIGLDALNECDTYNTADNTLSVAQLKKIQKELKKLMELA